MNLTELQELNPEKARAVQKLIYEDKLRSIKHAADFEHQKNHAPQPRTGNEPVASAAKYFLRESKAYGARISTVPFESIKGHNHDDRQPVAQDYNSGNPAAEDAQLVNSSQFIKSSPINSAEKSAGDGP